MKQQLNNLLMLRNGHWQQILGTDFADSISEIRSWLAERTDLRALNPLGPFSKSADGVFPYSLRTRSNLSSFLASLPRNSGVNFFA